MHAKDRTLRVSDTVNVMNFTGKTKWLHGVIVEQTGPVSFRICLDDGRVVCRHVDHVRSHRLNDENEILMSEKKFPPELCSELPVELPPEMQEPVQADLPEVTQPEMESPHTPGEDCTPSANLHRSRRIRIAPEKLNL